ncbi:MAG: response regulator transcription factor [Pseudonocardiaceae bacterium]
MAKITLDKNGISPTCRALLHGTSELILAGVRTILNAESDIAVVGEIDRFDDIESCVRRYRPNVLVTEYSLGSNAVNWRVDDHRSVDIKVPTVMLCPEPHGSDLDRAIRAGVRGLVLRTGGSGEVVDAVRSVAAGNAFLAPSIAGYVLEQLAMRMPLVNDLIGERFNRLTVRECEVLRLVASGLTTAEVAEILCRSRATVKSHISHILAKLELQDRAQAIALAYQAGIMVKIAQPG